MAFGDEGAEGRKRSELLRRLHVDCSCAVWTHGVVLPFSRFHPPHIRLTPIEGAACFVLLFYLLLLLESFWLQFVSEDRERDEVLHDAPYTTTCGPPLSALCSGLLTLAYLINHVFVLGCPFALLGHSLFSLTLSLFSGLVIFSLADSLRGPTSSLRWLKNHSAMVR